MWKADASNIPATKEGQAQLAEKLKAVERSKRSGGDRAAAASRFREIMSADRGRTTRMGPEGVGGDSKKLIIYLLDSEFSLRVEMGFFFLAQLL
jgi:hypothetical protein